MGLKTKLIITDKARLLIVGGLPEDAFNILIWQRNEEGTIHDLRYQAPAKRLVRLDIPKGNWQLLGKLHEISDRQWKGIVESEFHEMTDETFYKFYNPLCNDDFNASTATESGISLIEANCKLRNEYGEYDKVDFFKASENTPSINEWQQDQATVFTNPVIFIEKK